MLAWAILFLVAAIAAAVLGFGGIASAFAGIAQLLFFVFLAVFVATLVLHLMRGAKRSVS